MELRVAMRVGNLTQTVWNRSVRKQIEKEWAAEPLNPIYGERCAAIRTDGAEVIVTASASASGHSPHVGIYAAARAINDVAARGANPEKIEVSIYFPEETEEENARQLVGRLGEFCKGHGIGIMGVQAEVNPVVSQTLVQVRTFGKAAEDRLICMSGAKAGQDLILCGYIGLEGSLRILDEQEEELGRRFTPAFLRQMRRKEPELVQVKAVREAVPGETGKVNAMQQVGSGGIFAALWELAEASGAGLEVELQKMSILQETVEICEYYRLNPYQMTSAGAVLMAADDGEALVKRLEKQGAHAVRIGRLTEGKARIIRTGHEDRFLDRPAADELMLWQKKEMQHA